MQEQNTKDGWVKTIRLSLFFLLLLLASHCVNYGLLGKLEDPGGATATQQKLYAFIASATTTTANFSSYTAGLFTSCSGFTGQGRADCACQIMAQNANLPMPQSGKYISWTSTSTNDMRCRIQGIFNSTTCASLPSGGPLWQNTNGVGIANGYAGLFSGTLMSPLNLTETAGAPGNTNAYTGTNTDGTLAGATSTANCTDWSSGSSATWGSATASGTQWTNNGATPNCSTVASVYCFALP